MQKIDLDFCCLTTLNLLEFMIGLPIDGMPSILHGTPSMCSSNLNLSKFKIELFYLSIRSLAFRGALNARLYPQFSTITRRFSPLSVPAAVFAL